MARTGLRFGKDHLVIARAVLFLLLMAHGAAAQVRV